jgi:hypothetical protein
MNILRLAGNTANLYVAATIWLSHPAGNAMATIKIRNKCYCFANFKSRVHYQIQLVLPKVRDLKFLDN